MSKSRAIRMTPRVRALLSVVALIVLAACRAQPPAAPAVTVTDDTFAVVEGRQITRADVDKAFLRTQPSSEPIAEEEVLAAKLSLLDQLILQDLLLERAKTLKVEVTEKEVDEAFNATRQNLTQEAVDEELKRRKLTTADVREGLRRELLARKVIERELGDKTQVTDAEVTEFFNANREQFNLTEDAYRLAQIVVTPVADPQPANLAGDDAATPQEAQAKAAGLMRRLQEGAAFDVLARDHSEDPQTAPRGGDLGLVPVSALKQIAPALRNAVLKSNPGAVTPVNIDGMHTLVLVMGLEKAGQRDPSMPQVRENIVSTLRGRKEQLLRAAYLTALRSDADVENYFARRILLRTPAKASTSAAAGSNGDAASTEGK
jgi:peptidyl-prolyl cis-trans isomerase SurA